ncbi:uncharacterized protein LOC143570296 [Bidens hawaiensis]|uniref:uncharacterized protein LOC143570296 n=1 Tax=Bidens hawaiensis TaxID=980011 RepID=UPI00404A21BF
MSTPGPTTTTTVEKPPRRFPPPCWTQDEALALIQAYRERWYALRRGYLRTADWDAVAEHLGRLFPGAVPPKTSAQCRHKMEKLRQRYRAEKQRALAFSGGRFLSTWFFFQAMDSMEKNGTGSGSNNNNDDVINTGNDVNNSIINRQLNMNVDSVYGGLNPGRGIRFKPAAATAAVAVAVDSNMVNVASRVRVSQSYDVNNNNEDEDEDDDDDEFDDLYYSGKNHRLASQTNPRKYSKIGTNVNANAKYNYKRSYWNEDGESDDDDDEDMSLGGMDCDERMKRNSGERDDDSIGQIVSSIKALADGFVKVERMKMEMVHEIERMRMEAEMKRNKMVLESQKQIVEAFVKGLENKRQRQ